MRSNGYGLSSERSCVETDIAYCLSQEGNRVTASPRSGRVLKLIQTIKKRYFIIVTASPRSGRVLKSKLENN